MLEVSMATMPEHCTRCGSAMVYRDELGNVRCLCCGHAVWCGRDREAERRDRQRRETTAVARADRERQMALWAESEGAA